MSLFGILLSLTTSSTCLGSDLGLWIRTANLSPDIAFLFIVGNKTFCFRGLLSSNAMVQMILAFADQNQ